MPRTSSVVKLSATMCRRISEFMRTNNCGYIVRFLGCEIGIDSLYIREDGTWVGVYNHLGAQFHMTLTNKFTTPRYIRHPQFGA